MRTIKMLLAALFSIAIAACGGGGGSVTPQATYSISGAVSGAALAGVTINLTGTATTSAITSTVGAFSIASLANGSYTITPSKTGYTFNPANTAVSVSGANVSGTNFTATANGLSTYSLSGTVTGAVLQNVLITLSGTGSATTLTNASGNYSFSGIASGNYTVTPSLAGYTFSLASNAVTISGANATVGNFVSTAAPTATTTFSIATVTDPLAFQQWGMLNTGQTGFADSAGIANTGGTLGTDINVNTVYSTYGYTGLGVTVAIVDSGLEILHEDLSTNVVPGGSWNFINSTTDPTNTIVTTGDHGTMVSGLIAMAMNGKGGIGVAPKAQLKGFNVLSGSQLLADYVASLGGSSANPNSSDVAIFNQSFGLDNTADTTVNTTIEAQYASGTSTLRGGKGALYVKSAGNGFTSFGTAYCAGATGIGISCQNANFDPDNTLPYNIVTAALNAKGTKASYSTAGSAIWASTPGGEVGLNSAAITQAGYVAPAAGSVDYEPAMVTTDQSGCAKGESVNTPPTGFGPFSFFNWGGANLSSINLNCSYTNGMNGTSSAAPMMSGAIALILEANSALTWREVKDILARTSVQVDAARTAISVTLGDGSYVVEQAWITNAAGRKFHNWYGFGAVDVSAAVNFAKTYVSGSLGTFANTAWITSGALTLPIADNSTTGASAQLAVPAFGTGGIVEAVQIEVTTTATLGYAQDLGIELTSPSGTKSILKNIRDGLSTSNNLAGMVLASNAFYGESSTGTWTVKVVDGWSTGGIQTLTNVQIRVYGH